jgi:predicted RNA-binding protein with PIN domain
MALHIIIDGYNFIRNSPELKELDRQDIQLGREALIDLLATYKKVKPHKITVVFDGVDMPGHYPQRDRLKGITIKYSRTGESADKVIIRMAAHEKERALVVSSDKEIIRSVTANRAAAITSPEFADKLWMANIGSNNSDEREVSSNRPSKSTQKKGPSRRLSKRQRRTRGKIRKL